MKALLTDMAAPTRPSDFPYVSACTMRDIGDDFNSGRSMHVYGPAGVGKTCLIKMLARNTRTRVIYLNGAIDTVDALRTKMAEYRQHGGFSHFIIDEYEHARNDLMNAVLHEQKPFVLITKGPLNPRLSKINQYHIKADDVSCVEVLERVCGTFGLPCDLDSLADIVVAYPSDLRQQVGEIHRKYVKEPL